MTQDGLAAKRESLEDLEKHEREARRLADALSSGGRADPSASAPNPGEDDEDEREDQSPPLSASLPAHPGPSPVRRRAPGMGLLSALSYTLHGMIDADPEAARRNSITKTRETIGHLEDALHLSAQDLKYSSSTIQADLDRFQRQKVADIREMCIEMARTHRDWCQKVRLSCSCSSLYWLMVGHCRTWRHGKRRRRRLTQFPTTLTACPKQTHPKGQAQDPVQDGTRLRL